MRKETFVKIGRRTAEIFATVKHSVHPKKPIGVSGFPGRGSGGRNHIEIERDWWYRHDPKATGGVSGFPGRGSRNASELTFQEQFGGNMPHPLPQK